MSESEALPALTILIVDDEESILIPLEEVLKQEGYRTATATSAEAAIQVLEKTPYDVLLTDLKMPGKSGLELIDYCQNLVEKPAIILMTAYGSHDIAVDALRRGAYDYISKPFDLDEVILTIKKVAEREKLIAANEALKQELSESYNFSKIISESKEMKLIFETVKRLANFSTTILISGESGTGKELLAKAIHYNSDRQAKPFVAVNCGAIPESLIESELFGHKMGSFTDAIRDRQGLFEEADGGTIFLDEIGELPLHLQVKLLRVLQEQTIRRIGEESDRKIDVRILAATNRDLEQCVKDGTFREDLFYRLNVVHLHLPPLRERIEDLNILVKHFIRKHNKKLGVKVKDIDPDVRKCFAQYVWKGNIRELENCIERGLVLAEGELITVDCLPDRIRESFEELSELKASPLLDEDDLSIKNQVRNLETQLILKALEKTDGNRTHAAKLLEISHRTLLYKLKEYGLTEAYKGS